MKGLFLKRRTRTVLVGTLQVCLLFVFFGLYLNRLRLPTSEKDQTIPSSFCSSKSDSKSTFTRFFLISSKSDSGSAFTRWWRLKDSMSFSRKGRFWDP